MEKIIILIIIAIALTIVARKIYLFFKNGASGEGGCAPSSGCSGSCSCAHKQPAEPENINGK